ncbi:MAG: alpha-hydroxy acid oxidase, partial [Hydrogenophaga sp.]|uniref:alpha-hydroxy acid oxidase n=1 Tax=Hydrogenophaga sp. TaxID=1904254 RepID=UPI004036EB7F
MTVITNVEDLRVLAQKRVPRMFYDYADSGSWTEGTYRANNEDFQKIKLRQRVAVNMENRSTRSTMIGQPVAMPVAIAPTGLTGMQHADGEILAARAARKFGIPFTLSTMSICSIEDVAQHAGEGFWFQLYVMRDRGFIERLIDRAKAARCGALVLTLDLQIIGQRHKDLKNGLSAPPKMTLANLINIASKPRWAMGMLGTPRRQFGNIVGHVTGVENMGSLSEWTAKQFDPALNWGDVEWIKKRWGGKLILKGIQDVEDAKLCVASGADALIVSNHGGRQLDGAQSSIEALPA